MPAPDSVLKLCETFAEHREHFRSGNYNEFQLRKQFLDPLFEALGWDMANSQGLAPQYRDVTSARKKDTPLHRLAFSKGRGGETSAHFIRHPFPRIHAFFVEDGEADDTHVAVIARSGFSRVCQTESGRLGSRHAAG